MEHDKKVSDLSIEKKGPCPSQNIPASRWQTSLPLDRRVPDSCQSTQDFLMCTVHCVELLLGKSAMPSHSDLDLCDVELLLGKSAMPSYSDLDLCDLLSDTELHPRTRWLILRP